MDTQNDDIEVGCHVLPTTTTTHDLGSSSARFLKFYSSKIADTGATVDIGSVLQPTTNNTFDLGQAGNSWAGIVSEHLQTQNGYVLSPTSRSVSTTATSFLGSEGNLNCNGDIVLYNSTKNCILFDSHGISIPTATNRSVGEKICLYPVSGGIDYAIGISTSTLWNSVPNSTTFFKWYHGTTENMRLGGSSTIGFTLKGTESTNKFLIEDSGGTDVFIVDTINHKVIIRGDEGTNKFLIEDSGGADVFIVDTLNHKVIVRGDADDNKFAVLNSSGVDVLRVDTNGTQTIRIDGHLRVDTHDTYDIGASSLKWDDIYATNGTIITSDEKDKEGIQNSDLGLDFINKLQPKKYKWKGKARNHYGLIAQEVHTALEGRDFAGYCDSKFKEPDEPQNIGMRYHEFISPMIKAIQELTSQVQTLQAEINELKKNIP